MQQNFNMKKCINNMMIKNIAMAKTRLLILFLLPLLFMSCATKHISTGQTVQGADSQSSLDQRPVDINWCYSTVKLSDLYDLSYNVGFYGLSSGKMKPIKNENFRADIINKQTKESMKVEINDLSYSQLSRTPMAYALSFWMEYGGHRYLIHGMYDTRARDDKSQTPLTTGCYMIK